MNRQKFSFRCLMVIFVALLSMNGGLAQETTTTTTDGGSQGVVESVTTTESTNVNVTEQSVTPPPVTDTRVTVDRTEVAGTATPGDNQTMFIVGGLILLALVGLIIVMVGKRNTSADIERTTQYRG